MTVFYEMSSKVLFAMIEHLFCLFSAVLIEWCDLDDSCDLDAYSFKGIFVRNLRYLIDEEMTKTKTR